LFCFRRSLRHRERRPAHQERQHRRRRHIHLQSQGLGNREPRRKRHQAGGEKTFMNYQLKSQFKTQARGKKTLKDYLLKCQVKTQLEMRKPCFLEKLIENSYPLTRP